MGKMNEKTCTLDGSEFAHIPKLLCCGYLGFPSVKRRLTLGLKGICLMDTVETLLCVGRVLFMGTTEELNEAVAICYLILGISNLLQVVPMLTLLHQRTLSDDRSFLNHQRVKRFYHHSVKFVYLGFFTKAILLGAKVAFFVSLAAADSKDLLLPWHTASKITVLAVFGTLELLSLYLLWSCLVFLYERIYFSPCDCHSGVDNPELFHRYHPTLFLTQNAIAEADDEEDLS